ncbi:MAG: dockerin type I repeat-containing protein [Clostridia bacterium]|nr:dockerin type I repeat-containing protein [Clostridia bacterium]
MKKVFSLLLSIIFIFSAVAVSAVAEEVHESDHTVKHIVVPETCTVNGMEYDLCLNCRKTFNQTVIPKSHKFTHVVESATCTAEGTEYDLCSVCGERANETVIPVIEHSWGEWRLETEPTAAREGTEERECTVCHNKDTRAVDRLKTLSDEKSGISIVCGDAFPKDVELSVSPVNNGNFEIYDGKVFAVFEISAFSGDEKVQPDKPITLMFDESKFDCGIGSLTIYHFPEKGNNETFSMTRKDSAYHFFEQIIDGKVYFCITVSSLSPFVIVDASGDVDYNEKINSTDALMVLRHSAGIELLTGYSLERADVTHDGAVNSSDALKILQYQVGLIENMSR